MLLFQPTFGGALQFDAVHSGEVTCRACNFLGCSEDHALAIVSDVPEGFQLKVLPSEVTVGDRVHMACAVPTFNCTVDSIVWLWQPNGTAKPILVPTEKGDWENLIDFMTAMPASLRRIY